MCIYIDKGPLFKDFGYNNIDVLKSTFDAGNLKKYLHIYIRRDQVSKLNPEIFSLS